MRAPIVYCYARVSTEKQVVEGNSIEDQEIRLKSHVRSNPTLSKVIWGGIFTDPGTSGMIAFADRAAGKALHDRLKPGDHIVMTSIDRGFRNFRDCVEMTERWLSYGVHLHIMDQGIATNTPQGQFVYRLFAALADMMRKILLENVARGMRIKYERYGTTGANVRLMWKNAGSRKFPKLVPYEEERRYAALIVHLSEDLGLTRREIMNLFHHYGLGTTPRGGWFDEARATQMMKVYVNGGYTEPCLELPPPEGWKPWTRKRKKPRKDQAPPDASHRPGLPDVSSLAIRVSGSTRPSRAMRLLATGKIVSSSPPWLGDQTRVRRSGRASALQAQTPAYDGSTPEQAQAREHS